MSLPHAPDTLLDPAPVPRSAGTGAARASIVFSAVMALLLGGLAGCDGGDGASSNGGGGAGGSGGTGGGGAADACDPPPDEVPAVRKVTVDLQNGAAEDRYLLTDCHDCDTLLVEKKGDLDYVAQPLRVSAAEACGCECPSPGDPYPTALRRIAPGETFAATWDARTLVKCTAELDCGGGLTASQTTGALAPAGPGEYRVSFGVIVNLPAECTEVGDTGDFTCGPPAQQGIDPGGGFYPVEVTLAGTGDVSATLMLP